MKPRVFISYTHSDEKEVYRVEKTLNNMGLPHPWKDRYEINPGLDIEKSINLAIGNQCDIILVIMSAESLHAKWVKWEQECAKDASRSGRHIQVIYIKVKEFEVPQEIGKRLYVDYSFPPNDLESQIRATEDIARFFINYRSLQRIGVYDVFHSYDDMNHRRQRSNGIEGCDQHQFVSSAKKHIVAVGFFYANLFGADVGSPIAKWARKHCEGTVDLYVPDISKAPIDNLKIIYPYGDQIPKKIQDFIDLFKEWGRTMRLRKDVAQRIQLHLLSCCPTHSLLAVDPDEAYGRMIADVTSSGDGCDYQMKVEFRYPQTPLYKRYRDSLRLLESPEYQTETFYTSYL